MDPSIRVMAAFYNIRPVVVNRINGIFVSREPRQHNEVHFHHNKSEAVLLQISRTMHQIRQIKASKTKMSLLDQILSYYIYKIQI